MNHELGIRHKFSLFLICLISILLVGVGQDVKSIFQSTTTPQELKTKYQTGKIKILIVPGHDADSPGAEFRNIKELDLTIKVGKELYNLFSQDSRFTPFITRNENSYLSEFENYFKNKKAINNFIFSQAQQFKKAIKSGVFKKKKQIQRVNASKGGVIKLFGINKWANENNTDIVLHLHFNNYHPRKKDKVGRYFGFAIFVPDRQFNNGQISQDMAGSLFRELKKYWLVSNLPVESNGIIEDQQLIAIGANNSLNAASVLIEYGYIYEPQFYQQPRIFQELARQTYRGIVNYFTN